MSFGSRSLVSKYLQFIIHSQLTVIAKWPVIMRASLNNSHVSFESAASSVSNSIILLWILYLVIGSLIVRHAIVSIQLGFNWGVYED